MKTNAEILKDILEEENKNKREKKHNPHRHFEIDKKDKAIF